MNTQKSKIPVTIITGYLGAGKTTLLNKLIREYPEKNMPLLRMNSGDHAVSSHSFCLSGAFDLERFSYWIEYFLYINQSHVFRIKGILNFEGNPNKMILQSP